MSTQPIGIVAERQARTAAVIAANPHLEAKIKGRKPAYVAARSHEITVDLRSGLRTIRETTPIVVKAPAERKARKRIFAMPKPKPKRRRPDSPNDRPRFHAIVDAVCHAWGIEGEGLICPSRHRSVAYARFAAYRLIRDRIGWSTSQMAEVFRVDHTSCLFGLRQAEALLNGEFHRKRPPAGRKLLTEAATIADFQTRFAAALADLEKT